MTVAAGLRRNIFVITLLYSFLIGVLHYFISSTLYERGFSDEAIGFIIASGYALSLLTLFIVPTLLKRLGDRSLFTGSLIVTGAAFLAVSLIPASLAAAFLIPIIVALTTNIYVLIDVFLTTVSGDIHKVAGRRGLYITLINCGLIGAQLLGVLILARGNLEELYALVGAGLLALAALSHALFRDFRDAAYERTDWPQIFRNLVASRNLRNTFLVQFLLRFFYGLMVVYTPIYLLEYIGIPLEHLGFIFAFMLVPFVILEIPVGRLEDSVWHEREVLITGFALAALATATLAFITSASVVVWALALFATRVGAALIEIGGEAYFFKHVHGSNSGEVSAYRMLTPLSHILGPVLAALFILVLPFHFLFIALGAVMLLGIAPSSGLR